MASKLPMLDTFAGIGGFSLALKSAFRTVLYCEINPACQCVLKSLMRKRLLRKAPLHADVRDLVLTSYDLSSSPVMLTAGSPCVDLSSLQRNAQGIHGSRSSLIFEVFALLDSNPTLQAVYLENSPLMPSRGLTAIVSEFMRRGFRVAWGIFSARDVGAPHLRRRWYCLATRGIALPMLSPRAHNWMAEEAPRVVPKTTRSLQDLLRRAAMLGNSVVPSCASYAYNVLNLAAQNLLEPEHFTNTSITVCDHTSVIHLRRPQELMSRVEVDLMLEYRNISHARRAWATPVTNIYPSVVETYRAANMLGTQILHDRGTLRYIKDVTGHPIDVHSVNSYWVVNPAFLEWLMGYPAEWTAC
jgi:hypothetical protein